LVSDLPENCQYQDEGCELADSCLNCPFPDCIYDSPGGERRLRKERRNSEIVHKSTLGYSVKELAAKYEVSRRTVQRVIKKNKSD
jgi:hypothetical protein